MPHMDGSIVEFEVDRIEVTPTQTPTQVWQAYCSFRDDLS